MSATRLRPRNDPQQYEDLADTWWDRRGPLAMLHWIARSRANLVPAATHRAALLVDLGCGAGLLAPHLQGRGYHHVGVDLSPTALQQAAAHGMTVIQGDVLAVPLPDAIADVVTAGEILEHVTNLPLALSEACRLLRPGGTLVIDTIAATRLARFIAVEIGERIPGGAPPGIHDPALFVDRDYLLGCCAANGVHLTLNGLRPSAVAMLGWLTGRRDEARMVATPSTAVLFQGVGVKGEA